MRAMSASMKSRSLCASARRLCTVPWSRSVRISLDEHASCSTRSMSGQLNTVTGDSEVIILRDTDDMGKSFNLNMLSRAYLVDMVFKRWRWRSTTRTEPRTARVLSHTRVLEVDQRSVNLSGFLRIESRPLMECTRNHRNNQDKWVNDIKVGYVLE